MTVFAAMVVVLAILTSGCATTQKVNLRDPGKSDGVAQTKESGTKSEALLYQSEHKGIFPGPDNAISAAVASSIAENGHAEAEVTKARAELLRKYAENPEKYKGAVDTSVGVGLATTERRYSIIVRNISPYILNIGATGTPNRKNVSPGQSAEFYVPEKVFSVYCDRVTKSGNVPYKEKRFFIETPTPQVPFGGKIYAYMVRVN